MSIRRAHGAVTSLDVRTVRHPCAPAGSRRHDLRTSRAFYVGNLLEKFKIEDITTAIQTTWSFSNLKPKGELKYHQDTQLLIVFALPVELEKVTNILEELNRGVPRAKALDGGYPVESKEKIGTEKRSPDKR